MSKVRIPSALEGLTGGKRELEIKAGNLAELIDALEASYPGMKERLIDDSGEVRRFVNVYVNEEDVRFLDGLATKIDEQSEVSIIPAVAGGL